MTPTSRAGVTPPLLVVLRRAPGERISDLCLRAVSQSEAGAEVVLTLEIGSRSVGVSRPDELPYRLHNGDELELPDELPGFAVPVSQFFA